MIAAAARRHRERHPDAADQQGREQIPEVRVDAEGPSSRGAGSPSSVIPPVISQREPMRSESFPAMGATRMINTVIGRNAAPGLDRREAEDVLHVQRDEEEDAEHRQADHQDHDVRAGEGAVPEQRQVQHRHALTELEERRRSEQHGRRDERPDDPCRRPAVGVRLDQPVREREETEPRGDQAREVEPLLLRHVARLVDQQVARRDPEHADRDVDEEDPAPAEVLREETADERADRQRERGDARPDPDRHPALRAGGTWPR